MLFWGGCKITVWNRGWVTWKLHICEFSWYKEISYEVSHIPVHDYRYDHIKPEMPPRYRTLLATTGVITYSLLCVKNLALSVFGLVQFLSLEVLVTDTFGQLHTTDVQPRLGGNHVDLVDTSQRAAIQVVRAYKQHTVEYTPKCVKHIIYTLSSTFNINVVIKIDLKYKNYLDSFDHDYDFLHSYPFYTDDILCI